jgi:soluble lytic murein transglycosylase-like protein
VAVRIGGREVAQTSQAYGSRTQAPQPQVGIGGSGGQGLQHLASALSGLGAVGEQYFAKRTAEEEERQDFDALRKWNTFSGTFSQRTEEAKLGVPVDGAGYADVVAKEWDTGYKTFLSSIPERLRPQYEARAAAARSQSILQADNFTRGLTRENSVVEVGKAIDEAQKTVYQNPDADVDAQLAETIETAPGLSAAERKALGAGAIKQINGAAFAGTLREGRTKSFVVPYSHDVTQRVIPQIMKAESGGNPNAVSPKGAQGLMQVMPGTALQIAQDMHDPNFPFRGTATERTEYLKRPGVNKVYGTFYFNSLLKQFNGDLELALIGYNAGPARAKAFQDNGRNWAALPPGVQDETKPYVEKIMRGAGALTPDMAFDPEFGLDFEQAVGGQEAIERLRGQAEADAMGRVAEMKRQAQDAQDAAMQRLFIAAEAGGDGRAMYLDAIMNGEAQYDRNAMNAVIGITNRVSGERIATQEAFGKLTTGQSMSEADADRVITPDLQAGLLARDEGAIDSILQRTGAIGFVPPKVEKALGSMIFSGNIDQISAAAQTIRALPPQVVQSLPEDMVIRANSFEHLRSTGMAADEVQRHMDATRTTEQRGALAAAKKSDDTYEDNRFLPVADMADYFDSILPFTGDADVPLDPSTSNLLQLQYSEVYDAYYSQTMNSGAAKSLAMQHIAKSWGVTRTGGQQRLTWLPPEKALTSFRFDVDGDGVLEHVKQTPEQAKTSFDRAVQVRYGVTNYATFALPETSAALNSGRPIPYGIIPLDEDGNPVYGTPETMELLSGAPFLYDYGVIQSSMQVLLTNRELLQQDLEEAIKSGVQSRIQDIQGQLDRVNEELGE